MIDAHGEAIEADFLRYYQRDLSDYLTGKRKPAQALRLIGMLPPESATMAQMQAMPGGAGSRPERWQEIYALTPTAVLRDLFNLTVSIHTPKGKTPKTHQELRGF